MIITESTHTNHRPAFPLHLLLFLFSPTFFHLSTAAPSTAYTPCLCSSPAEGGARWRRSITVTEALCGSQQNQQRAAAPLPLETTLSVTRSHTASLTYADRAQRIDNILYKRLFPSFEQTEGVYMWLHVNVWNCSGSEKVNEVIQHADGRSSEVSAGSEQVPSSLPEATDARQICHCCEMERWNTADALDSRCRTFRTVRQGSAAIGRFHLFTSLFLSSCLQLRRLKWPQSLSRSHIHTHVQKCAHVCEILDKNLLEKPVDSRN